MLRLYIPQEHIGIVNTRLQKHGFIFIDDVEELHTTLLPWLDPKKEHFQFYRLKSFRGKDGVGLQMYFENLPYLGGRSSFNSLEDFQKFSDETQEMQDILKNIQDLTLPYDRWRQGF